MNLYTLKARGNYGGGMAVVAAADEQRARELASTIRDSTWQTDYRNAYEVTLLRVHYVDKEGVLDHFETGE